MAATATGLGAVACAGPMSALGKDPGRAWVTGKQINPDIDNLRVVHCADPAMLTGDPQRWDIESQNAPVVAARVRANVEAMACALAQKPSPAEAWATIFRKPEGKAWPDVKVAIKPNASGGNITRVAVIDAVLAGLTGLGVRAANVTLYGCPRFNENEAGVYAPFLGRGLPGGVVLSKGHEAMGGTVEAVVPEPAAGRYNCAAALADGSIDLLVNIATNKGHFAPTFGGMSLTMKNHAGSFEMPLSRHLSGGLDYVIAFNKSEAILGGTPPRQQLCIVDSLWGMTSGPGGVPNKRPGALSMGTFGPAVDWVVSKRVREVVMGCTHPDFLATILTEFGYAPSAFAELDFVRVQTA
jgi:hypothetical protein